MPADRSNRRPLTTIIPTSQPQASQAQGDGGDQASPPVDKPSDMEAESNPIEDEELLPEPDLDAFVPIYTGRHVWSARRSPPLVPFEDLPLPKTDRAKLPPCTIRWQFTGKFFPNRDEGPVLGSLRKQMCDFLHARKFKDANCMVNFPKGTGRNRMVDITVLQPHLAAASEAILVFRQAKLQRLFVGPALDFNYFVIEIQNLPYTATWTGTARLIWAALRQYVQLHDIWVHQVSYAADGKAPQDENIYLALVSVPKDADNCINPSILAAIPGYIKIRDDDLPLAFAGRLDWCTTCKSKADRILTKAIKRPCISRLARKLLELSTSPTAIKTTLQSSSLTVSTWNCATLNSQDRIAALHNPSTPTAHRAILGRDCGIIFRNTKWQVEDSKIGDYFAYAKIRIPVDEPAIGTNIRLLHIWSIHAPPIHDARLEFWSRDVPNISILDAAAPGEHSAAIIGADWNAVPSPMIDDFPPPLVPTADSCLWDNSLKPALSIRSGLYTQTAWPTLAIKSPTVNSFLHAALIAFGPRTAWSHIRSPFRRVHLLQTTVLLRSVVKAASKGPNSVLQLPQATSQPPIQAWYSFVERIRATTANIANSQRQQSQKRARKRNEISSKLSQIDIRHGDENRRRFLELLTMLRLIDRTEAADTVKKRRALHELNMFVPTAWIIPKLESRAFASLPALKDCEGTHESLAAKLDAIRRFYTTLFTPTSANQTSEEASSVLLSSVRRKISSATRHKCDSPFTVAELQAVLKRSVDDSAPGMDGVTYPLLRTLGEPALERLCAMGNALLRGHSLPDGEPNLRGVMLPKKGDLSQLKNYRPLSIAAVAFRILGGVVSSRLQAAAQEVIASTQTGFILGRHSASNVVTLYLLHYAVASGRHVDPIWILNLDQQKAYNRVRREWLLDCLLAYGFGSRFITYIRENYRHPTVCQSAEGHFTPPIPLQCGILQGDPMSCLLYNFMLQPMLDYAQHRHHAGTLLDWDPDHQMFVSSLAFADDILLVVNNKRDLAKFMDALDLYEMASNAKVNEEKSQAFFFVRGANDGNDLQPQDIPYPFLGDPQAEVVHLGYPFRLDGGIPQNTIDQRLNSIQAKVNILASTKTTLLARARIVNSFLLSKLWHSIRLCPVAHTLQRRINSIINPFLFLSRRNWILHKYVVAPRHLGGLGVIDTTHMFIALIGQIAANLLQSTEPLGHQFRAALQQRLWTEYKAIPAHFLLRRGLPWLAMNNVLLAQRSFLNRVVYALAQLRLSILPDWDNVSVKEILSLPFHSDLFGYTWPEIHETNTQHWERHGLRVWGDVLWYNHNEKGKEMHPYSCADSYPLVPPSPSGVKSNYVPSRGHPDTYELFSGAAGRLVKKHWIDMWRVLHPTVRKKLLDITKWFRKHPDKSKSIKNPMPHDQPFDIDTVGLPFPWHIATLAGKPLKEYTVRHARTFLAPSSVIVPDWDLGSTDQWKQVWQWHTQDSLLTSQAQSDIFLFLHRRPWLAQKPRGERRLANYDTLNEDEFAPRLRLHQDRDNPQVEAELEPVNDSYETEHVFGVAACMLCNGPKDSARHGFIECPEVQKGVWKQIMGTLKRFLAPRAVPLDAESIVLGWPTLRMPSAARARLLLWRDLAIHILSRRRHDAIVLGLSKDHRPQLSLDGFFSEHAALLVATLTNAYHGLSESKRAEFQKRWFEGGTFLQVVNGAVTFQQMSNTANSQIGRR
ncbi:hypothetical protein NDA14_007466 [Ustilago hordei]|nr:hypothetical protein NDA14_007466 [Ustilago hordei]